MSSQQAESKMTPEVQAMIGVEGDIVEMMGVVDQEYLRRFAQALMDPDPMYWDEEWAKNSKFGRLTVPPIMVSYMSSRIPLGGGDPVTQAFEENPFSDGIGSVKKFGELPNVPTDLVRVVNGGNELELYEYPSIGDRIKFQHRYSDIRERVGREGNPFLLITRETKFYNQDDHLLCITRATTIRR
ncbi:MAG: MaoC family dehydratase [SAR202 cluster bacterium]|jgi:hypothetical protein|nr:hypothetical protein [Chloroflexota bacterium]MCH2528912.1 MaoC family dehydratase N-terminal domain-containing protein [Dehalococcoidia bacterium]MQG08358.1 MaoC family dehydratase [SAR202 cluster bacterium]MQG16992.1 MaoC family dehydratase [SAR202 cluster bacterium]MQG35987.1 MaoC family dehydratase [SAR202 cluster bacterium]|tara:strand:+ start:23742 stop:24296 length:555 start_codon:yes stop_codon:yes gene_type:complete